MDDEGFSGRDGRTTIFDYWSLASLRNWITEGAFDGGKLTAEQRQLREVPLKLSSFFSCSRTDRIPPHSCICCVDALCPVSYTHLAPDAADKTYCN